MIKRISEVGLGKKRDNVREEERQTRVTEGLEEEHQQVK